MSLLSLAFSANSNLWWQVRLTSSWWSSCQSSSCPRPAVREHVHSKPALLLFQAQQSRAAPGRRPVCAFVLTFLPTLVGQFLTHFIVLCWVWTFLERSLSVGVSFLVGKSIVQELTVIIWNWYSCEICKLNFLSNFCLMYSVSPCKATKIILCILSICFLFDICVCLYSSQKWRILSPINVDGFELEERACKWKFLFLSLFYCSWVFSK